MTPDQTKLIEAALASSEIRVVLTKLNMAVTFNDVQQASGRQHVFEYKRLAHLIKEHERDFAEKICGRERDDVLLLGNTEAIEGFFLRSRRVFQMKWVGQDPKSQTPGSFVQAFLDTWQNSRGWQGIMLFILASLITTAFAKQRWDTRGTQPKLEPRHLNGQISRMVVHCPDGVVELPLVLASK